MEYLVLRSESVRPHGGIKSSDHFPMIIDVKGLVNPEIVVKRAFDTIKTGYVGMHEYLVIPMDAAIIVGFSPRTDYNVNIRSFNEK